MANMLDDLRPLLYNPGAIQSKVLSILEENTKGKINIPDPNNPFVFLVESNALVGSAVVMESAYNIKKMYPQLATTKEDLYHHLADNELQDIFATPATGDFRFFINKKELLTYGIRGSSYIEIIMPKFTKIIVNDVSFTLLNDIDIRLYDTNKTFVRLVGNDLGISHDNDLILNSGIITDGNLVEWIIFDVSIQQLLYTKILDNIVSSKPYSKEILINDQYCYTDIKAYSPNLNDMFTLRKTYSNFVYNPNVVTAFIKPIDNKVLVEIPLNYILDNMVANDIIIDMFTTKGELILPLQDYKPEDIEIQYPDFTDATDNRIKALQNTAIYCKGLGFTYGGRNEIGFEELKNKIIYHTTGDNEIPITEDEIMEELNQLGYDLVGKVDTILDRIYIANKKIGDLGNDVDSLADIFMDTLKIDAGVIDGERIKTFNNSVIINPFTIFKLENGNPIPLNNSELDNLLNTTDAISLMELLNNKKLFYNIYKYITDYDDELKVRAYDLNAPRVFGNKDTKLNDTIDMLVTLSDYRLSRVKDDYYLYFRLNPDDNFLSMDLENIKLQLTLLTDNKDINFTFFGNVYSDNIGLIGKIKISTTGYIDNENKILIKDFLSKVSVGKIDLINNAHLLIYSTKSIPNDTDTNMKNKILDIDGKSAIYQESLVLEFGKYLKYLYSNYDVNYTNRKYKKYENDIYLTYAEDIYELDESGTPKYEEVDTDGDDINDDIKLVVLHKKGDPVLDEDGNPIILHKKGDVILDEDGNPIIDFDLGIEHYVDILFLEYPYRAANNNKYINYRIDLYTELTRSIVDELEYINSRLLENTVIKYKPKNNLKDVKLTVNNLVYVSPNFVTPVITIYVVDTTVTPELIINFKSVAGKILQQGLRDNKRVSEIANEIANTLGESIVSVKITNLDSAGDVDIKKYTTNSSQIVINKILTQANDGTLRPELDIKLDITSL